MKNSLVNQFVRLLTLVLGLIVVGNASALCTFPADLCDADGKNCSVKSWPDIGSAFSYFQLSLPNTTTFGPGSCSFQFSTNWTLLRGGGSGTFERNGESFSLSDVSPNTYIPLKTTVSTYYDRDTAGNCVVKATRSSVAAITPWFYCAPAPTRIIALSASPAIPIYNSQRVFPLTATITLNDVVQPNRYASMQVTQSTLSEADQQKIVIFPVNGKTDADGKFSARMLVPITSKTETFTVVASCAAGECANSATLEITSAPAKVVIGFFNGVSNTEKAATQSRDRLETEFGEQYKDTPLKYELFYNETACREGFLGIGKVSCLEDVAEVFAQRANELDGVFADRWEIFWDVLAGRHQQSQSITGRLMSLLGDGGNALVQWLDSLANAIFNRLASILLDFLTLFTNAPTTINQAEHLSKLQSYADEGAKFLMVAHSQGNLFVNRAYDDLLATRPGTWAKVVHVAPASPTLRGEYTLADIDVVINGLRVTGINSVPNANIRIPFSSQDASGHGFEPTYLDKMRAAYANIRLKLETSLNALTQ